MKKQEISSNQLGLSIGEEPVAASRHKVDFLTSMFATWAFGPGPTKSQTKRFVPLAELVLREINQAGGES